VNAPVRIVLDYDDPHAPEVDPDMVIKRAARSRVARRIAAASAVVLLGLAGLAVRLRHDYTEPDLPALTLDDAVAGSAAFRQHPPVSPVIVVDSSVPGWVSVVWLAAGDDACGGSLGLTGDARGREEVHCWGTPPPTDDRPVWSLPLPQVNPMPSNGKWLVIGLVRSGAASIRLTFRGLSVTTAVHSVYVAGKISFGGYAVWVPIGASAFNATEFDVVAYDSAGNQLN
jgi:hypothetical protein